jgi:hypothetical protein
VNLVNTDIIDAMLSPNLHVVLGLVSKYLSKWFYDTSTGAATGAARCGSIDERGGHEDLRGLDHRSVIPYVHGRTGLYCSSLPCLYEPEPFSSNPCEVASARAFYSSRSDSYNES